MNSITELRNKLNDMIKASTDKAQIDSLSSLNTLVDNVESDTKVLVDKNAELLNDYKQAVLSSGYKGNPDTQKDITGKEDTKPLTLEEIAQQVISAKK